MFVGWLVVLFGTVIVVLFVVELGFCFVVICGRRGVGGGDGGGRGGGSATIILHRN